MARGFKQVQILVGSIFQFVYLSVKIEKLIYSKS